MSFPPQVKEDILVATDRCCALCHKFCGIKIEIHHIIEQSEGGTDTFENGIPLCFDCHADMRSYDHKHPKGTKYTREELARHRDAWYARVKGPTGAVIHQNNIESDKVIYFKLIKTIPWDGTMSFISSNNFAGFSFERKRLEQFHEFEYLCEDPSFEFMDSDLEHLRATLRGQIRKFTTELARNSFPTHSSGWSSIPEEWEYEQPERFNKVTDLIHETAGIICGTYKSLVQIARRKLGVLPPHMA